MTAQKKLLTISEASKFLGVSPDTLRRWEKNGHINPIRTLGNNRRYRINDLEDIKSKSNSSSAPLQKTQEDISYIKQSIVDNLNNSGSVSNEEFDRKTDKLSQDISNLEQTITKNFAKLQGDVKNNNLPEEEKDGFENQPSTYNQKIEKGKTSLSKNENVILFKKFHINKKYIFPALIIFFLLFITIILFLIFTQMSPIILKLENISLKNTKSDYSQIDENLPFNAQQNFQQITIGKDKTILDEKGNIYFSGGITGGYIDTSVQNLISNSGFELNPNGKPD